MRVANVHERAYDVPAAALGALIDGLASADDRLWPRAQWPPMRLHRPLAAGARGGHGPVRYVVEEHEPGRRVVFRFTAPKGFDGTHAFAADADAVGCAVLRHELVMHATGPALLTWPLFFRPLHDALIEDALDCAEGALTGRVPAPRRWSPYVRVLRAAALLPGRRRRPHRAGALLACAAGIAACGRPAVDQTPAPATPEAEAVDDTTSHTDLT
jgi:hypothetical protein